MIALNSPIKPNLKKLYKLLEQVNSSGWFTNFGPMHKELTERLEAYLGVENLLLTNNGTSALQVASRAMGTQSIIATPFSFVATVSAYEWQKDELAFADIDPRSLNLSPKAIDAAYQLGCKADTVVATHVYGNPCDVESIEQLSKQHNFKVIYDAAHAFGVNIDGRSVLNYGDASTLSFHATKVFHTVEGGAIVFKDRAHLERAEDIINFGIRPGDGVVDVGINAKLNEYQAAVGLVNLEDIDDILNHRSELFYQYRQGLKELVELPLWHPEANANGAYMPILLESQSQMKSISSVLANNNIQSRHYFAPSLDTVFTEKDNFGTKNSQSASERILCLPMHAHLSTGDVDTVLEIIKKGLL
ncbi:dTDP-4-amino-4,6-dideoxy-D-glucose transaminase [Vibrio chagasii]|uniref:DegT/DnrJ/EryC1/StrS aminotransferase family protein n=1 Tax=unclassified Vibrio TaxID=2614977 RepID=UPI001493D48B|nr:MULTISPECIES: DegT/DnrJ/EryC1/StrS family aminotransferase [unclassified Vibrio]CAH6800318.1 dTDP-4-amino-4,6-dideoxy-D-glucose transaminase [Vibrio chagasii]NOI37740.1 DegT/DnrJ/EryC1/StrS family aminotransferase [Vibrio sp. 070316B]NOI85995.1 DegT/DnrJ/EryC1/StrS family aminotransferase [Vibrio sp. 99K-1]CAH6859399.1 dTDP-4-amino-4,6-dideoxy-D-glucose transaminase [Vibrio chagasii]CAH6868323.1 dTDP-4-amino-4,6-dideoxy-D-glucose transaminase [Vibrio chagasii]